ncbi:MAG TPA: MotA/TolQ/ExbB proton channel family protein [Lacunisphaera sp.]
MAEFFHQGGPVMLAIAALSIVLYSRCCNLLLGMRRAHKYLDAFHWRTAQLPLLRQLRHEAQQSFRQHRIALGAMVAAAPLLGLLGTVSGMVKTFESLATSATEKSMEGLARGISEVLVATESGLAVAIPALVIIYYIHGRVRRYMQRIDRLEAGLLRGVAP